MTFKEFFHIFYMNKRRINTTTAPIAAKTIKVGSKKKNKAKIPPKISSVIKMLLPQPK